ncbi:helix-turn-helix domain-containing protein [Pseudooceanicola sp. 216_PA32_1]|uniref:Helix-turn-helix domain-containing protein n=1 Tax=Pseudooceanicola pacificus TaxID=2676438 RepID=A0A844W5B8_9RHOB|nr:helix-turn-helix domain-containing protein [Pseudooceanicola pacificus]MWB78011.1 helix-turn-helix domain-containing protein [Pseudooceanicola pacificus]
MNAARGQDRSKDQATEQDAELDASMSSTLMRGIEILQCFSASDQELSNAEIARRMGLKRPTVSRLCKTLLHLGYLRKTQKGAFRLAPRLLSLNYPVLATMPWRHNVVGPMREMAEMCSGNASIGVMSGDSFVHVQTAGLPPGWPHVPDIGQSGPLHHSALGWSILSMLSDTDYSAKIEEIRAIHGQDLDESRPVMEAAVARCRAEGFCVSYGDWRPELVAAGAPIGRTEDGLYVAIACAVPRYRAVAEYFENDFGPRLAEAAASMRLSGVFKLATPLS